MRIAESECGSSPIAFIRLNVSRQEIPASTRIRVEELCTIVAFPRLPLASTDNETPMREAYSPPLWKRDNFLDIRYLRLQARACVPSLPLCHSVLQPLPTSSSTHPLRAAPPIRHTRLRFQSENPGRTHKAALDMASPS